MVGRIAYSEKNDDFVYLHTWFHAQLAQKILNGTYLVHMEYGRHIYFSEVVVMQ